MSILIDGSTKVLCQGITGSAGAIHTKGCLEYGTKMVGGVTPGKGGTKDANGLPIFDTVLRAVKATGADATMIFVPPAGAADAILEAADAGIRVICAITEGVPVLDMVRVREALKAYPKSTLIGPNCPGVITPGWRISGEGPSARFDGGCKIGIMPGYIHKKGRIGVVSRSGTLTYEAVAQLMALGLGQSTCIGIGGDPVNGLKHLDILQLFNDDDETDAVLMVGEIGGTDEEDCAHWVKGNMRKPVVGFIAGVTAPPGKRMGHAGAIISGGKGTAQEKLEVMESCGIKVTRNPAEMGKLLKSAL